MDLWCLAWWWPCLSSEAWAGWAQAVGTLLALFVAFKVAAGQYWREEIRRERDRREQYDLMRGWVAHYATHLRQTFRSFWAEAKLGRVVQMRAYAATISEISDWARTIPVAQMPLSPLGDVLELRAIAAQATATIDQVTVGQILEAFAPLLEQCEDRAAKLLNWTGAVPMWGMATPEEWARARAVGQGSLTFAQGSRLAIVNTIARYHAARAARRNRG